MELSQETKDACEKIVATFDDARHHADKAIKNAIEEVGDKFFSRIMEIIMCDINYGVQSLISNEVENRLEKFLTGDMKTIEEFGLTNRHRYQDVRLAIWSACSPDIENSLIKTLQDENEWLRESLKSERSRY